MTATPTKLQIVPKPVSALPFDDARGKKLIEAKRAQLLAASIRYFKEGRDGSMPERSRTASSASGIPIMQLEVEARK